MRGQNLACDFAGHHAEVVVTFREAGDQRVCQDHQIAGRGVLLFVWQARGVSKYCPVHAELLGFRGHLLRERLFTPLQSFRNDYRDIVGRAHDERADALFDGNAGTGPQPDFSRRLNGGFRRHTEFLVERDLACIESIKQQVQRHDLGQRSRIVPGIRLLG